MAGPSPRFPPFSSPLHLLAVCQLGDGEIVFERAISGRRTFSSFSFPSYRPLSGFPFVSLYCPRNFPSGHLLQIAQRFSPSFPCTLLLLPSVLPRTPQIESLHSFTSPSLLVPAHICSIPPPIKFHRQVIASPLRGFLFETGLALQGADFSSHYRPFAA